MRDIYKICTNEEENAFFEEYEPIIAAGLKLKEAIGQEVSSLIDYRSECTARVYTDEIKMKGKYGITRESALFLCDISKDDWNRTPQELRKTFEQAMDKSREITREMELIQQKKIQLDLLTARGIEASARQYSMSFSDYVVTVAHNVSLSSPCCSSFEELMTAIENGLVYQAVYSEDEVKQAMDKADISASQAVTLIKELERLRDERKNPKF